jgi:RNA polymerase sigma-70 factor (ECF subfamily)
MKKLSTNQISVLKRRISQGDNAALMILYDIYFAKLKYYGLALNPPINVISIDDVIQDLFLWIATNPEKLEDIDNLEVYLFVSLKINIRNKLNLIESKHKTILRYDINENIQDTTAIASVENEYIESETLEITQAFVKSLLDQLPPNQRQVLYLRNYANLSYREISEIMTLSEQVVRNYAYRALLKLRQGNQGIDNHANKVS